MTPGASGGFHRRRIAWYHPLRLTIDSGAVAAGNPNPAQDVLEVCTCSFNRETPLRFVEHLDLRDITRVCQDRGGILGLSLPMEMPRRFARLLVMNTRAALTARGRTPAAGG